MPDRKQLLTDFYKKYAPDQELSEERLKAIDNKYGDNNEAMLKDFYKKYAPNQEVTPERLDAIYKKYQLTTATPPPQPPTGPQRETPQPRNKVAEMLNQPKAVDILKQVVPTSEVTSGTKKPVMQKEQEVQQIEQKKEKKEN